MPVFENANAKIALRNGAVSSAIRALKSWSRSSFLNASSIEARDCGDCGCENSNLQRI